MMIIVYEANNFVDANIVRDILAMEGVESHVMGGLLQDGVGELQPFGLIKIMIHQQDFEKSREIIIEWESNLTEPESENTANELKKTSKSNEATILIGGFILACLIGLMYLSI